MSTLSCFKAYDIRGRLGAELNEDIAWRIGRAYGQYLHPKRVAVGGDIRPSSSALKAALAQGLVAAGVEVLDLGLTGTEEIYFAVFSQNLDGGIEVTGSHNPLSDNGLKLVREGSRPISGDSGLFDIKQLAEANNWAEDTPLGSIRAASFKEAYVRHLLSYISPERLRPLKIVVNAGNGVAGPVLDLLADGLAAQGASLEFIRLNHEPDGRFPNGIPNPLLPQNRSQTAEAVKTHGADLGLAWDGDFDRCFFFDEHGNFIEGYYLVGLLAETLLVKHPGAKIIHDPRLTWNTIDLVEKAGGQAIQSKTGHAFIKERMRLEQALYGGEMSAHHYFADFAYCDSGMIPWLLIIELMSLKKASLSSLVAARQRAYPCSGEINYTVKDIAATLARVKNTLAASALKMDFTDGLSLEFPTWRFNLRGSNTEPLLRLNLETRGNPAEVSQRVAEIEALLR